MTNLIMLIVCLFFSCLAKAECPIQITKLDGLDVWGTPMEENVYAKFKSSKPASAVDFKIVFVDHTLTPHQYINKYEWSGKIRADEEKKVRWKRPLIYQFENYPYVKIIVLKVIR